MPTVNSAYNSEDFDTIQWLSPSPAELVDRHEQINEFELVLDRIQKDRLPQARLFEWYGGPGIGKTQLTRLLERSCQQQKVPYVHVSFDKTLAERLVTDPTELVELMAVELFEPAPLKLDSLREKIEAFRNIKPPENVVRTYYQLSREKRLYERPEWLDFLREVTNDFIGLINSIAYPEGEKRPVPVVIFFDETEYAHVELVDWIEEWIISPLAQTKHCVIVWTARRPWRWKRPEIRRRIHSEQLSVFRLNEVKTQMKSRSSDHDLVKSLFQNVYAVTNGHPSANAIAVTRMNMWADPHIIPGQKPFDPEQLLVKEIYNEFIRKYAFKGLVGDEQIACELMSMVRIFDTVMLQEVLQASGGRQFENWTQEDFGDLLLRLKRTQLLTWKQGYTVDPDLRHIIRRYFLTSEPETFITVNRTALDVYRQWLSRPVNNRNFFVMEEVYHQASLIKVGESVEKPSEVLRMRLLEYPARIEDKPSLRLALEHLQGELKHDIELNELTNGISSTELVRLTQDFLNTSEASNDEV